MEFLFLLTLHFQPIFLLLFFLTPLSLGTYGTEGHIMEFTQAQALAVTSQVQTGNRCGQIQIRPIHIQ